MHASSNIQWQALHRCRGQATSSLRFNSDLLRERRKMRRTGCQCAEWISDIPLFDACELVLKIPTALCFLCFELLQPLGHICIDVLHPAWIWDHSQTQTLKTCRPEIGWIKRTSHRLLINKVSSAWSLVQCSSSSTIAWRLLFLPTALPSLILHSNTLCRSGASVCLQIAIPNHKPCLNC